MEYDVSSIMLISKHGKWTDLKELVRCLLVFPGHGTRSWAGEGACCAEDGQADQNTDSCVKSDLSVLIWRRLSPGAVGTEGNPVG
jgi:hypothetical protein